MRDVTMSVPSGIDTDGIRRDWLCPVGTHRPKPKYQDCGRVMYGGRAYKVTDTFSTDTVLGYLFILDDGRIFATPDTDGKYSHRRWIGGMITRMEAVLYLRAHVDAGSAWWEFRA